jgi:uncharacterized membrane protein
MHLATSNTVVEQSVAPDGASHRAYRLTAIDFLRGLVIVIMAIDHVRDYFLIGTDVDPMANPNISVALFATRWLTHFCAPVFVLLAGRWSLSPLAGPSHPAESRKRAG